MKDSDASYYQAHKDDQGEWGEAQERRSRRRLSAMVSVRFSPEEAELVRRVAEGSGRSLSDFIRHAAVARANQSTAPPTTLELKGWTVQHLFFEGGALNTVVGSCRSTRTTGSEPSGFLTPLTR